MSRVVPAASTGRKRKFSSGEELNYSTSFVQPRRSRRRRRRQRGNVNEVKPQNSTENAEASDSDDPCASCYSRNGSSAELHNNTSDSVDLEVEESVEVETSTYQFENGIQRRETTPSSEVQAETGELESTALRPSMSSETNSSRLRQRQSTDEEKKKMPSKAELEEFFSAAEKNLQQNFAQKYNFDIVKVEPLEGRYEWFRLKP
ncbi:hypothetical protein ACH5RR_014073 [Cinchona calisaya]|uniref:Cyclin-dependent kinase inhibitor n=1 Tax=Cinchona calisaya TaxID=153742 RepID=A0ABD3A474_9GENT